MCLPILILTFFAVEIQFVSTYTYIMNYVLFFFFLLIILCIIRMLRQILNVYYVFSQM